MRVLTGLTGIGDFDRDLCQRTQPKPKSRLSYRTGEKCPGSDGRGSDGGGRCVFRKAAAKLAKKYDVSMPIVEEVNKVLFEGKSPAQAVDDLMQRESRSENRSLTWEE